MWSNIVARLIQEVVRGASKSALRPSINEASQVLHIEIDYLASIQKGIQDLKEGDFYAGLKWFETSAQPHRSAQEIEEFIKRR